MKCSVSLISHLRLARAEHGKNYHKNGSFSLAICTLPFYDQAIMQKGTNMRLRRLLVLGLLAVAASVGPAAGLRDVAAAPARVGPTACQYDGIPLIPKVDVNHAYGWGFVANFDHAPSGTLVTTCLAERYYGQAPWQTTYTVSNTHCVIVGNGGPLSIGGGSAPFNGNFRLACTLPVPATTPALFWIKARAALNAPSSAYTFVSGTGAGAGHTFSAATDAACAVTLSSAYRSISYSHSASGACGALNDFGSNVARTGTNSVEGRHKIGAAVFGPATSSGTFNLPANFTFDIGAIGQNFTLDWLVIDPTPTRCCSPG
jgi:hypothetical protein